MHLGESARDNINRLVVGRDVDGPEPKEVTITRIEHTIFNGDWLIWIDTDCLGRPLFGAGRQNQYTDRENADVMESQGQHYLHAIIINYTIILSRNPLLRGME
jgi:hypothetical protein